MTHSFSVRSVTKNELIVSISVDQFIGHIYERNQMLKFMQSLSVGMGVFVEKHLYAVDRKRGAFKFGVIESIDQDNYKVIVRVEL